jgi:transposase
LDVSKDDFTYATARSDEAPFTAEEVKAIKVRTCDRTRKGVAAFLDWAKAQVPEGFEMLVVMESTGPYSLQLAAWLLELSPDLPVTIVDPKRPKAYAVEHGIRNKTDKIDARVISAFAAERRPAPDEPVEQIYRDLRALVRLRQYLNTQLTALRNNHDMQVKEVLSIATAKFVERTLRSDIDKIRKQVRECEAQMRKLVKDHERLREDVAVLDTIAGVGFLVAVTILAELGDLRRFENARELVAKCGLDPKIVQSGKRMGQVHISKCGSAYARAALYMAALATLRTDCDFRDFYLRLTATRGKKKSVALTATMRKVLTVMWVVINTGAEYERHHEHSGKAVGKNCENIALAA